jgi:hypothetical protein
MDLRPCSSCARHVRVDEDACPFCTAGLEPAHAQNVAPRIRGRAALFFATLAACGSGDKPADPPPKPVPADAAAQPAVVDAAAIAPVADAGVAAEPADAAVAPADEETKRKWREAQQKRLEKQRVPVPKTRIPPPNKPYGAPPARKRVV